MAEISKEDTSTEDTAKERGSTHWIVKVLYAACAMVAVLHLVLALATETYGHAHFAFEKWPLFPAIFGFIAFSLLVVGAKLLRAVVKRPEDYYGDKETVDSPESLAVKRGAEHD